MPYFEPGVRPIQQFITEEIAAVEAELPTIVIGPLYEVFEQEAASGGFDPLTATDQVYTWPSLRVGTVVDLEGVRNGLIDSQRKDLAPYVPTVYLVDGTTSYPVDDADIDAISQTGFELKQTARDGLDRGSFSFSIIDLNNTQILYNPTGGLADAQAGDRLLVGATDSTVATVTDTVLTVDEDISGDAQTPTRVDENVAGSDTVVIAPSATAGRVVVTVTGTDFVTEVPAIAVGDVAVTAIPMTGLTAIQGQADTVVTDFDGLTFGVDITLSEVDNYIVKIVNYASDATYTTVDEVYFSEVTAIDTTAGTLSVAAHAGGVDEDYCEITIMEAQTGYVESINVGSTEITVVVPDTFADTQTFVDIFPAPATVDVYPAFEVEVDYRALRADLSDTLYSVGENSELLSSIDHTAVSYLDGLAYAVNVTLLAQPNERDVYFIPVDVEPSGSTGLPENYDLTTGYQNALDVAESAPVYNIVLLDRSSAIDSALQAHVTGMSDEEDRAWRRGFFIQDVPLGATQSTTGLIEPGRTANGLAPTGNEGNTTIRDANVNFVTGAGIVTGTQVVVTYPPEFAGTYAADGATTDSALILTGTVWDLTKEFAVTGTADLNTTAANTHVLDGGGISATQFAHVEAGDYVELTESATVYRLLVTAATSTQLTLTDDVAGALDFGTGNSDNASVITVIRTWGPSNGGGVEYHISPLTKSQQITAILAAKSLADRRFTLCLNQSPTLQIDSDSSGDPILAVLDPSLTLCAIAAKRSGSDSSDEVTNLTLEGGISKVRYGYNYFKRSQLNALAEAGFTLAVQKSETAEPYIRDMVTTAGYNAGLVNFEELVTSTVDWISKTLVDTFGPPVGARLPKLTDRLLGLRAMQTHTLFSSWVDEERLLDYELIKVRRSPTNPRQTDICVAVTVALAEKEIEFIIETTV